MSSTGIVAMFIPVVLGRVAKTGISRSRLMMPLPVAALISGLMTLIATERYSVCLSPTWQPRS